MVSQNQQKYLEEYEKFKHVEICPGIYTRKSRTHIQIQVESVNTDDEKVTMKTLSSGHRFVKTLHWCRKNLERIEE